MARKRKSSPSAVQPLSKRTTRATSRLPSNTESLREAQEDPEAILRSRRKAKKSPATRIFADHASSAQSSRPKLKLDTRVNFRPVGPAVGYLKTTDVVGGRLGKSPSLNAQRNAAYQTANSNSNKQRAPTATGYTLGVPGTASSRNTGPLARSDSSQPQVRVPATPEAKLIQLIGGRSVLNSRRLLTDEQHVKRLAVIIAAYVETTPTANLFTYRAELYAACLPWAARLLDHTKPQPSGPAPFVTPLLSLTAKYLRYRWYALSTDIWSTPAAPLSKMQYKAVMAVTQRAGRWLKSQQAITAPISIDTSGNDDISSTNEGDLDRLLHAHAGVSTTDPISSTSGGTNQADSSIITPKTLLTAGAHDVHEHESGVDGEDDEDDEVDDDETIEDTSALFRSDELDASNKRSVEELDFSEEEVVIINNDISKLPASRWAATNENSSAQALPPPSKEQEHKIGAPPSTVVPGTAHNDSSVRFAVDRLSQLLEPKSDVEQEFSDHSSLFEED